MKTTTFKDNKALKKSDKTSAIRDNYIDHHNPVDLKVEYTDPRAIEIFHTMPASTLPILPAGYLWSETDKYSIIRADTAVDHDLLLVLYGPGNQKTKRINYVFQTDGMTTYSFAHTRNGAAPKRKHPMKEADYRVPGFDYSTAGYERHIEGHQVDHKDTIQIGPIAKYSTYDPRNFIPETPQYGWGMGIRRLKVAELRRDKNKTAYAQLTTYPDKPLFTNNGTAVPEAAYLYDYAISGANYNRREVITVEWDEDLTKPKDKKYLDYAQEELTTGLDAAPSAQPYLPSYNDRDLRTVGRDAWKKVSNLKSGETSSRFPQRDQLFALHDAADLESENAYRKLTAGIFADSSGLEYEGYNYADQSVKFGQGLLDLDDKRVIFSPEAIKSGKKFFSSKTNDQDFDSIADHFEQLTVDQRLPKPK